MNEFSIFYGLYVLSTPVVTYIESGAKNGLLNDANCAAQDNVTTTKNRSGPIIKISLPTTTKKRQPKINYCCVVYSRAESEIDFKL